MSDQPQHLVALDRAQTIRLARAAERKRVFGAGPCAAGMLIVASFISEPPECLETLTVAKLLSWPYRSHRVAQRRLLWSIKASESMTVGGLTARQRTTLVAEIHRSFGDGDATVDQAA